MSSSEIIKSNLDYPFYNLIKNLGSVECSLMDSGINNKQMKFYYCSCDIDKKEPMCKVCIEVCHSDHNTLPLKETYGQQICHCGLSYHGKAGTTIEVNNNLSCFFSDWSSFSKTNIYYSYKKCHICIFCKNFCQNFQESKTNKEGEFKMKKLKKDKPFPECDCLDDNHKKNKSLFEKLSKLTEFTDYNFPNLSLLHIINLLFKSEKTCKNLFHRFFSERDQLKKNINDPLFKISSNLTNQSDLANGLKTIFVLSNNIKFLPYFSEAIKLVFDFEFTKSLMQKHLKNISRSGWNFKLSLISNYRKIVFTNDFKICPYFTVSDMINMNPLTRLILIGNVLSDNQIVSKYLKKIDKIPYIDSIFNFIDILIHSPEKNIQIYKIFRYFYSIVKNFSKYYLLTKNQISRFCQINDEIIKIFVINRKNLFRSEMENKFKLINDFLECEVEIMLSMTKAIIFIVYFLNDKLVEKYIKNDDPSEKISFFHGKNESSSLIYRNTISILNFIHINYEKKNKNDNDMEENGDNEFYKIKNNKKIKKSLKFSIELTSLVSNNIDNYLIGFRKLLDQNKKIYLDFLSNNLSKDDLSFVDFLTKQTKLLENIYTDYYSLNITFYEMKQAIQSIINEFFSIIKSKINLPDLNESFIDDDNDDKIQEDTHLIKETKIKTQKIYKKNKLLNNSKYQLLMNKSFFVFSLVKFVKIQNEFEKISRENCVELPQVDYKIYDEILKVLYFYTKDNSDNCSIALGSEFVYMTEDMNKLQIMKFIDFEINCLNIIKRHNYQLISISPLINSIKEISLKLNEEEISKTLLGKLLKFLNILIELPSLNDEINTVKMRKLIISLFKNNKCLKDYKIKLIGNEIMPVIDIENNNEKQVLIPYKMNSSDKSLSRSMIDENILINYKDETHLPLIEMSILSPFNQNSSDMINNREMKRDTLVSNDIKFDNKMFIRYLRMLNYYFDSNHDIDYSQVKSLFTPVEIQKILKRKDLDIFLRTELLKLFHRLYINPGLDFTFSKSYISVISKPTKLENEKFQSHDILRLKLMENILSTNTTVFSLKIIHYVIKNEMNYFNEILSKNKKIKDLTLMLYLEEGIIVPVIVYFDKFMNFIFQQTGVDYIKLFELTFYFLKLKKFIFEHKEIFKRLVPREKRDFFKNSINFKRKIGYLLFNANYTDDEYQKCLKDLENLSNPQFKLLNHELVSRILKENLTFIKIPKSMSLVGYFEKEKLGNEDDKKIFKIREKLVKADYMTTRFEKIIFEMVTIYENDKQKLESSYFIKNLNDVNEIYFMKYRLLFISFTFSLLDMRLDLNHYIQNLWNLLKLLQYDTIEIQNDCRSLYEAGNIDLKFLMEKFCLNLIGLIYNYPNPTISVINENYYIAINIIKIFKYLCEEHNLFFQEVFFRKIEYEYFSSKVENKKTNKIKTFSLMLNIIEKILIFSNWESTQNNSLDNEYYYDIFFVIIEFLIEMIQGSSIENLKALIDNVEYENLNTFLVNIKPVLSNKMNESRVLKNVIMDLAKFLSAFVEEKNIPTKIINLITFEISPLYIMEIILVNIKKLYLKLKNQRLEEIDNIFYDYTLYEFFLDNFYYNKEFILIREFEIANQLFNYVKVLDNIHNNNIANKLISSVSTIDENFLFVKNPENIEKFKFMNNVTLLDVVSYQNYFLIKFFEQITRTVEIQMEDGNIQKINFTLNPETNFLSDYTKNDFLKNVNRDSRYNKIIAIIENSEYFYDEIVYHQNSNIKFKLSLINYHFIEYILYGITFLTNLLIILFLPADDSTGSGHLVRNLDSQSIKEQEHTDNEINIYLNIIQCAISFISLLIWIFAKLPLIYEIETKRYIKKKKINLKSLSFLQKMYIMIFESILLKNQVNTMIINAVFAALSITFMGTNIYFPNSIQLLLIINLSETIKNIVKAITYKWVQLITIILLMIVCINAFSYIAFFFMRESYLNSKSGHHDNICSTLLYCFFTHLNLGLRTDGGIGELLKEAEYDERALYMGNFFFILLFFIIIVVILLALVFGIIIDSFVELKEKSHIIEHDSELKCYICGEDKDEFEKMGKDFTHHVNVVHNIWNYIYYMIGLKFVDLQETNSTNTYAIIMIQKKSISWVPSFKPSE